jgi:magnesium-transporting ATPase (P-type)
MSQVPIGYSEQSEEEVLGQLSSSATGLSSAEAISRLSACGPNTVSASREDTALSQLLRQFKSPIILILLMATVISAITKDWSDAAIIGITLAICDFVRSPNGTDTPLDNDVRTILHRRFEPGSAAGQRILGLAVRRMDTRDKYTRDDEVSMTFVGFLFFADPSNPMPMKPSRNSTLSESISRSSPETTA